MDSVPGADGGNVGAPTLDPLQMNNDEPAMEWESGGEALPEMGVAAQDPLADPPSSEDEESQSGAHFLLEQPPKPNEEEELENMIFKMEPDDWPWESDLSDVGESFLDYVIKKEEPADYSENDDGNSVVNVPDEEAVAKLESQCPESLKKFPEPEIRAAFAYCSGIASYNSRSLKPKGGTLFNGVLKRLTGDTRGTREYLGFGRKDRVYLHLLWQAKYQYLFPQKYRDGNLIKKAKGERKKAYNRRNYKDRRFWAQALIFLRLYPDTLEEPPSCTEEELELVRQRELERKLKNQEHLEWKRKATEESKAAAVLLRKQQQLDKRKKNLKKIVKQLPSEGVKRITVSIVKKTIECPVSPEVASLVPFSDDADDEVVVKQEVTEEEVDDIPVQILEISELEQKLGKYLEIILPRITENELVAQGRAEVALAAQRKRKARPAPKSKKHWVEVDHDEWGGDELDNLPVNEFEERIATSPHQPEPSPPKKPVRAWSQEEDEKVKGLEWEQMKVLGVINDNTKNDCSVCGKTMSSKSLLTLHLRTHFSFEEHKQFLREIVKKRKGSWDIEIDKNVEFQPLINLKSVEMSSSQQKFAIPPMWTLANRLKKKEKRNRVYGPAICAHCGKTYTTIYLLKTHERLAHSEGPVPMYNCPICGKPFSKNDARRTHMPTHLNKEELEKFVVWPGAIEEFIERLNTGEDLNKPPVRKKGCGIGPKSDWRERKYLGRGKRRQGRPRTRHHLYQNAEPQVPPNSTSGEIRGNLVCEEANAEATRESRVSSSSGLEVEGEAIDQPLALTHPPLQHSSNYYYT